MSTAMQASPLRVIELGCDIAAPYSTKLLVDLGANVIKIEGPNGDPLRAWGPFPRDAANREAMAARGGGLFQYLNAGKRSVILSLADDADRARFRSLVERADLLVESTAPGTLKGLALGFDELRVRNPRLAVVRITSFGQSGPYRDLPASSLVLQAAGGWVARLGVAGRPPVYVGGRVEEFTAGAYAAAAALTACRQVRRSGEAVEVDVSIFECLVNTLPFPMLQKVLFDQIGLPVPQRYQAIPGMLRCADGHVGISALTGQHWLDVCQLLEAPEFAGVMREMHLRGTQWEAFLAKVQPWLDQRTGSEIVEVFQAARVPAVPIGNGKNMLEFEQFRSRGFFVAQPGAGFLRPAGAFRLDAAPPVAPRVAPRLGEHSSEVLDAVQPVPAEVHPRSTAPRALGGMSERTSWKGGRPGLPFSDIKVLDLSSFWAGPFPAMYFASLGADVIKVESVRRPDGFRFVATAPEFGSRWWERSPLFQAVNLGKRDVTLELTKSRGLDLLKRLLVDADVLIENYSPRVIEEFGLSADVVRALNPAMVMVRMPGFGLTGPWRDYVGWGLTFEQMGGCAAVTGEPDGPPLVPGGFADPVAGMHAAAAIQAALAHRESTGQGRLIEVAQVEVVACLTAEQVIQYSMNGELMVGRGNRAPQMAPQGVYPCAGDDEWVALSIRDDADWECLRRALGDPAWAASPELRNVEGRMRWHDKLDAHLAAWTAPQAAADVAQLLQRHHVPAARLLKTGDIYGEPHLEARRYFQELEHPVSGRLRFPGWPMRFSFGPSAPYAGPAPTLGQHNEEILSRILGLSSHAIEQLRQARIIGESVDG